MQSTNWKGYRAAAWVGQALLAIGAAVVMFQGQALPAIMLSGFFIVSLLFLAFQRKLPALFDLLFVIAALINEGGSAWNLYNQPGPYDEIAHFYTIFAITLAAGYLLYGELIESFSTRRTLFVITVASLGIALGALWEIVEWLADFVIPMQIVSGLPDTITDMMLDSGGALLAALFNLWGLNELSSARPIRAVRSREQISTQASDEPLASG